MFAFHVYPNVCIPSILECLHSMYTRMSTFYAYPNVYIPSIPECLHSMYTQNNVDAAFGSRLEKKGH